MNKIGFIKSLSFLCFLLSIKSLASEGSELSFPIKHNLRSIGHCNCENVTTEDRLMLLSEIEEFIQEKPEKNELVIISYGSGKLELELNILAQAVEIGYQKIHVFLVDFYEKVPHLLSALKDFKSYARQQSQKSGIEILVEHSEKGELLDLSHCDELREAKVVSLAVDPQRNPSLGELVGYRWSAAIRLGLEAPYTSCPSFVSDGFDFGINEDPGETCLMFEQYLRHYYELVARINRDQGSESGVLRRHFILHQRLLVQISTHLTSNQIDSMDLIDLTSLPILKEQANRLYFTGTDRKNWHPMLHWLKQQGFEVSPLKPINRDWVVNYFSDFKDLSDDNNFSTEVDVGESLSQFKKNKLNEFLKEKKKQYFTSSIGNQDLAKHAFAVLFVSYAWEYALQDFAYNLFLEISETLFTKSDADNIKKVKLSENSKILDRFDSTAMALHAAAWSVGVKHEALKAAHADRKNLTLKNWNNLQNMQDGYILLDRTRNSLRNRIPFDMDTITQIKANVLSKLQQMELKDQESFLKASCEACWESVYFAAGNLINIETGSIGTLSEWHEEAMEMMRERELPATHDFSSTERFEYFFSKYFGNCKNLSTVEGALEYLREIATQLGELQDLEHTSAG